MWAVLSVQVVPLSFSTQGKTHFITFRTKSFVPAAGSNATTSAPCTTRFWVTQVNVRGAISG